MNHNFLFKNVNDALPVLMDTLLTGDEVGSRAGRTKELTHVGITLRKPWQREIVLPERKASIAAQIAETMWVLSGRDDIEWLSHYLPRAADFSDDGKVWRAAYGPRLRNWTVSRGDIVDQVQYVVDTLRASPSSRQAVISLWDPAVDTTPGKDIACNNWLNFSSRLGKLDLHVVIRSNDAMWGWSGINAFEWSALQEIVAGMVGIEVGSLHFSVTSFHLYDQHWNRAIQISAQQGNFLYDDSPRFNATGVDDMESFDEMARQWFQVEYDIRTGSPLVQHYVDSFPEPMLQSWLRVLQWWWSGDQEYLKPLRNTRLYEACKVSIQPKVTEQPQPPGGLTTTTASSAKETPLRTGDFLGFVKNLHEEKHAAYGDSWKRRGEYMIMANIARKIDRLGTGKETADETSSDTAIDLMVYLGKYRWWLADQELAPLPAALAGAYLTFSDWTQPVDVLLQKVESHLADVTWDDLEKLSLMLTTNFSALEERVKANRVRYDIVDKMLEDAYMLARHLW